MPPRGIRTCHHRIRATPADVTEHLILRGGRCTTPAPGGPTELPRGGVGLESKFRTLAQTFQSWSHQVNKAPTIQLGSEERGEKPMGENSGSEWAKASPPGAWPEQTPGAGTRKGLQAGTLRPPPSTEPGEKQALGRAGLKASQASTLNSSHQGCPISDLVLPHFLTGENVQSSLRLYMSGVS